MRSVPSAILRKLQNRIARAVSSDGGRQVIVVGPEGRGKTTLIKDVINHGHRQSFRNVAYSYYDFQRNANHNFQVMVTQWSSELISHHPMLNHTSKTDCLEVFNVLNDQIPQLQMHIKTFLRRLLTLKYLDRTLAAHITSILKSDNEVSPELWYDTCLLLLKHAPGTMGIHDTSSVGNIEPFFYGLYAVGIIAEKTEIEAKGEHNSSSRLTGIWATKYVLRPWHIISRLRQNNWILCLDSLHELIRSPFLNDRGGNFIWQMVEEIQANNMSAVLISDECTATIPFIDQKLANNIDDVYMRPRGNVSAEKVDPSALVFLDVPEIEPTVARGALKEGISNSENIARALLKVSGGNLRLINSLINSYRDLESSLDLPAVHQILAGSNSPVDDEYFPLNGSLEDQVQYLKDERCRMFVRNVHNAALKNEVGKFENMMNRFLSLPAMESARHRLGDNIHFLVTVYETVRYLLSKPLLQLHPEVNIENKIILSLLASGIMHLNVESRTMEFKDALTRLLIEAFIDNEYGRPR
ncbi:uncharacterized protein BXIN_1377 [Babesia sp. Xinjiang]|uniref:uncharacterized protein n=1 Tax=Babesia sp. Xinjiang TaxID=462227 RepID=UPI000A261D7C|nr:uncharacterized protein BXIN_1377 [Babesia sp. Xinjiang]ORM40224.1 hypothetical protein BXIN_1377 [Babesia sp. Xinjiang]